MCGEEILVVKRAESPTAAVQARAEGATLCGNLDIFLLERSVCSGCPSEKIFLADLRLLKVCRRAVVEEVELGHGGW